MIIPEKLAFMAIKAMQYKQSKQQHQHEPNNKGVKPVRVAA